MWNDSLDYFVKVIRFDNLGFNTKPYNSTRQVYGENAYCHCFSFLKIEVTDLELFNENLPINIKMIEPPHNDLKWSGCFVFVEHYDPKCFEGALFIKKGHQKNISLLNRNEKIWVRNSDYRGKRVFSYYPIEQNGKYFYTGLCSENDWVLMTVDNALERIRKGKEHFGYYPEELTEAYIMHQQVKSLLTSPKYYNYMSIKELLKTYFKKFE